MEVLSPQTAHEVSAYVGGDRVATADGEEIRIPRPANAFMLFGKEFRKVLANKFQDLSNKQISKILGDEWKKMDVELKTHYHKLAEDAHRQHLEKYPGYYYSPLEARQRKAERKRKSKMSRSCQRAKTSLHMNYPVIEPFGGNRSFPLQSPMHQLIRPVFGTPIPPRARFAQHVLRYGPNQPFGGFFRYGFPQPQPRPVFVVPVAADHSYAAASQPTFDQSVQQFVTYNESLESQTNETQVQTHDIKVEEMSGTTDIDLLSTFLPPMHNPTEATAVVESEDSIDSNEVTIRESEVTKMSNASIDKDSTLKSFKDEPFDEDSIDTNETKVVVKSNDQ